MSFDEYRRFARVFRESPVSLQSYIQHNYMGWRIAHPQLDLLHKLVRFALNLETICSCAGRATEPHVRETYRTVPAGEYVQHHQIFHKQADGDYRSVLPKHPCQRPMLNYEPSGQYPRYIREVAHPL